LNENDFEDVNNENLPNKSNNLLKKLEEIRNNIVTIELLEMLMTNSLVKEEYFNLQIIPNEIFNGIELVSYCSIAALTNIMVYMQSYESNEQSKKIVQNISENTFSV